MIVPKGNSYTVIPAGIRFCRLDPRQNHSGMTVFGGLVKSYLWLWILKTRLSKKAEMKTKRLTPVPDFDSDFDLDQKHAQPIWEQFDWQVIPVESHFHKAHGFCGTQY